MKVSRAIETALDKLINRRDKRLVKGVKGAWHAVTEKKFTIDRSAPNRLPGGFYSARCESKKLVARM